jgi:YD repeat-containing protein
MFSSIFIFLFLLCAVTDNAIAEDTYVYDQNNRLIQVRDGAVQLEFEYDGAGNRLSVNSYEDDTLADEDDSSVNEDDREK